MCVSVRESVSVSEREREKERCWIPEDSRKGQKWESLKVRTEEWPAEGAKYPKSLPTVF